MSSRRNQKSSSKNLTALQKLQNARAGGNRFSSDESDNDYEYALAIAAQFSMDGGHVARQAKKTLRRRNSLWRHRTKHNGIFRRPDASGRSLR